MSRRGRDAGGAGVVWPAVPGGAVTCHPLKPKEVAPGNSGPQGSTAARMLGRPVAAGSPDHALGRARLEEVGAGGTARTSGWQSRSLCPGWAVAVFPSHNNDDWACVNGGTSSSLRSETSSSASARAGAAGAAFLCTVFPCRTAAGAAAVRPGLGSPAAPLLPAHLYSHHRDRRPTPTPQAAASGGAGAVLHFSRRVRVPDSALLRRNLAAARPGDNYHIPPGVAAAVAAATAAAVDRKRPDGVVRVQPLRWHPLPFAVSCTVRITSAWLAGASEEQTAAATARVRASLVGLVVMRGCSVECRLPRRTRASPRVNSGRGGAGGSGRAVAVVYAEVVFLLDESKAFRVAPSTAITVTVVAPVPGQAPLPATAATAVPSTPTAPATPAAATTTSAAVTTSSDPPSPVVTASLPLRGGVPTLSPSPPSLASFFRADLLGDSARAVAAYLRRILCCSPDESAALASVGFQRPRGMLVHGPAGVGKSSLVAHAVMLIQRQHHEQQQQRKQQVQVQQLRRERHPLAPRHHHLHHPPPAPPQQQQLVPEVCFLKVSATGSAASSMQAVRRAFARAARFLRRRRAHGALAPPRAPAAAAVVLIDDIDVLCPDRARAAQGNSSGGDIWQVAQMLTLLDGLSGTDGTNGTNSASSDGNILVVATSRNADAMDPALRRPGRLEREFALAPPTPAERRTVLDALLRTTRLEESGERDGTATRRATEVTATTAVARAAATGETATAGAPPLVATAESTGEPAGEPAVEPADAVGMVLPWADVARISDAHCVGFMIADFVSLVRELLLARHRATLTADSRGHTWMSTDAPAAAPAPNAPATAAATAAGGWLSAAAVEQAARLVSASMLRGGEGVREGVAAAEAAAGAGCAASRCSKSSSSTSSSQPPPSSAWDSIGGLEAVKLQLQQSVLWPLRFAAAFRRLGVAPQKGILLYGPPGCAKTTLVRALATSSGAAFVPLSSADVYSPFVGEAEATIRRVFHRARSVAPTILFLDEVEALVGARDLSQGNNNGGGESDEVQTRILSTLLTEMDGVEPTSGLLVVGATNRPDLVDKALLRPGRFDRLVEVGLPDAATRASIFAVHLRAMPTEFDPGDECACEPPRFVHNGADGGGSGGAAATAGCRNSESSADLSSRSHLQRFAAATGGLSGADIEAVCREAAVAALRRDIAARAVAAEDVWRCIADATAPAPASIPTTTTSTGTNAGTPAAAATATAPP